MYRNPQNNSRVRPWFAICLLASCAGTTAAAHESTHPVSVTAAYVYVSREQATAKIQVFLEDLFLFHNLKPNGQDFLEPEVIRDGIKLHKQFVADRFMVRDVAGLPLAGRLVEVQAIDVPAEGVPLSDLMAHNLTFELQYELASPPEFLTFTQRFTDEEGMLPSEMKLILKQENAEEPHTALLRPDDVETVRFDWQLPPLSAEASEEERESWVVQQKEETLGITSYSAVYSFLYVDDHEVRHEILIPLLTLEQSVLIARDEDEFLDLAEQDAARRQIEAYFSTGNPVEVNGNSVKPVVQRCDFYGLDFKDFAMQAERKQVPMISARVGIILSYLPADSPRTVKLTWNRFNNFVSSVSTVVFAYDTTSKTTLTRSGKNNVFEWESPGRPDRPPLELVMAPSPTRPRLAMPLLSLLCLVLAGPVLLWLRSRGVPRRTLMMVSALFLIGAMLALPYLRWNAPLPLSVRRDLPDEEAGSIFAELHANMYRAFEFRDENDIYDALAMSVHGELLRDIFLQIRRGLEMQEQGGAVSRIRHVEMVTGQHQSADGRGSAQDRGFAYRCRWNVSGTVEHWGHIHERTNQYEALFHVAPVDNAWKVTNMELLDEQRVQFETRLRGV